MLASTCLYSLYARFYDFEHCDKNRPTSSVANLQYIILSTQLVNVHVAMKLQIGTENVFGFLSNNHLNSGHSYALPGTPITQYLMYKCVSGVTFKFSFDN